MSLLSVNLLRTGPEVGIYGNLCGPSRDEYCYEELLKGGYPYAYLFDQPGVSVQGQLHFLEDNFYLLPFLVNILIYSIVIAIIYFLLCKRIRKTDSLG